MAIVVDVDNSVKEVKNLGWLLAHNKLVSNFQVVESLSANYDVYLIAYLRDGWQFKTDFASSTLLRKWLDRPSFQGLQVDWYDSKPYEIGFEYEPKPGDRVTVRYQVIEYNQTTGHETVWLKPGQVARVVEVAVKSPHDKYYAKEAQNACLVGRAGRFYQRYENLKLVREAK